MIYEVLGFSYQPLVGSEVSGQGKPKIENLTFSGLGIYILHL